MKNPKLIVKPFAKNGQKNVIPENYETSMESNQATWDQGFGQITMLPVAAGGLPPKGQDFNGIFNQISENIVYLSQGGRFKFSAEYAEAIGGYPKGAILQSDDEKKEYLSLIDNNKVDFNTATDISASWKLVNTDDLLAQIASKQPKGDYATKTELNSGLAGKQPVGDYATKTEVGLKLDKTAVVQNAGASTTSVISQDGVTKSFMQNGAHGLGVRAVGDNNKPTSLSGAGFYATGSDAYKQIPANTLLVRFQGTADRFIGCASDGSNRVFFTDINGDPVDFYHTGNLRVMNSTGTSTVNPISQNAATDAISKKIDTASVVQTTGSSTTSIMSQKAATDNMLGVGQSWGDYSGSRQLGTSYTNATGKAIEVFCSCVLPISGTSSVSLEVNGTVVSQSAATSPGGNIRGNVSAIIPAGASYKVTTSNTTDVRIWVELR